MKKLTMVFLLAVLGITKINAQFGNVWLFRNGLKLDFNNDTVHFSPAQIGGVVGETNSSLCDSSGQLLFYSDGISVRDSLFNILPNGDTLGGCHTSHQGAIFIPHPGNANLVYLFTVDANWINFSINCGGNQSLSWALIDKSQNGGHGAVVSKRNVLVTPVKEKLTATRHCNGIDWWVTTHQWGNNSFYSFRIGVNGIDTIPVVSNIGTNYIDLNDTVAFSASVGDLKISPNGKLIAGLLFSRGILEIFEFNNETGQIFNHFFSYVAPFDSAGNVQSALNSCTFSKSSKVFYFSQEGINKMFQIQVNVFDSLQMSNSIIPIHNDSSNFIANNLFQLGPNGKVYFGSYNTLNNQRYIDEIKFPDLPYPNCQASLFTQDMNPTGFSFVSLTHFPNFPDCIFARDHTASLHIPTCSNTDSTIVVFDTLLNVVHDITWDFGDPGSGVNNTYEGTDPFHLFTVPGTYTITLTFTNRCNQFVIIRDVFIPNTTPPVAPTLILNAAFLEASYAPNYQWYLNDSLLVGATDIIYAPNQNGIYSVSTTQNGCTVFSLPFQLTTVSLEAMKKVNYFSLLQTNDFITLQCNPITDCFQSVELIDLQGRVLQTYAYQQKQSKAEINIGEIQSGIYFLRVNGREVRKVLKG